MLPSRLDSSSSSLSPEPPQQSGVSKIRPGRRNSKLPSSQEVFALGLQNPDVVSSSLSPNGSVDQPSLSPSSSAASETAPAANNRAKHPSKNSEKSDGARRLRGRPPELQKCYFVADDVVPTSPSDDRKTAANDPFWDAASSPQPQQPSSPRRPSFADDEQSSSFFKPTSSKENLMSTADVEMSCVLLPSGDIGATSTDPQ